jgi:hypothetical protein
VALGNRAFLASRTNTLLSVPMLFFMAAASHLTLFGEATGVQLAISVGVIVAVVAGFEALALLGTKGAGPAKLLDKHVTVLHVGLGLALAFYLLLDGMTPG